MKRAWRDCYEDFHEYVTQLTPPIPIINATYALRSRSVELYKEVLFKHAYILQMLTMLKISELANSFQRIGRQKHAIAIDKLREGREDLNEFDGVIRRVMESRNREWSVTIMKNLLKHLIGYLACC